MTESELEDGCRKGDRAAQREFYNQTSGPVYRLLLRMTRNRDAALDLAQDTYLRAFSRIGQFNGQSSLATWLYRIAVNEALQFLRRREPPGLRADGEASAPVAGDNDRVIAAMDLQEVLQRMDPLDRTVLVLRYQDGLDYRAIAIVMGCPIGTVASRLNGARRRLRELLDEYDPAEESGGSSHLTRGANSAGATARPADRDRMERRRP